MIRLGLGIGLARIKKSGGKNPWNGSWYIFSDFTNAWQVATFLPGF